MLHENTKHNRGKTGVTISAAFTSLKSSTKTLKQGGKHVQS